MASSEFGAGKSKSDPISSVGRNSKKVLRVAKMEKGLGVVMLCCVFAETVRNGN